MVEVRNAGAGIEVDKYKAHSTRAAATWKAKQLGLSVEQIVERANWSRATTFRRFYHKEFQAATEKQFQDKVLQVYRAFKSFRSRDLLLGK